MTAFWALVTLYKAGPLSDADGLEGLTEEQRASAGFGYYGVLNAGNVGEKKEALVL